MNFVKRLFVLLTLSAGVLLVTAANPGGAVQAQTTDHRSATTAGESTQAKIARALSAGPPRGGQGCTHRGHGCPRQSDRPA